MSWTTVVTVLSCHVLTNIARVIGGTENEVKG